MIEKIVSLLQPYYKATTILCADQSPTLLKVMPILVKLQRANTHSDDDPEEIMKMKSTLRDGLGSRISEEEECLLLVACILNPFTRGLEFLPKDQQEKGRRLLYQEASNMEGNVEIKQETEEGSSNV